MRGSPSQPVRFRPHGWQWAGLNPEENPSSRARTLVLTVNALQDNSAWHLRNRSFPLRGGMMTGLEATLLVVATTFVLLLGVAYFVRA